MPASPRGARSAIRPGRVSASRPESRRGCLIGVLIAFAVAAAVAVIVISSGSTTATMAGHPVSSAAAHRQASTVRVAPSSVTAAILNGTSTGGLAHTISVRLAQAGFKLGKVTNAASQTQTKPLVGYAPHHEAAALAVAKVLKTRLKSGPTTRCDHPGDRVCACGDVPFGGRGRNCRRGSGGANVSVSLPSSGARGKARWGPRWPVCACVLGDDLRFGTDRVGGVTASGSRRRDRGAQRRERAPGG